MMDLEKVQYFHAVAQTGSISKAALVVGLSQPALSLQIQTLEHRLGVKLFERHSRGILLTDEGKVLYERSLVLQDWMSETQDLMSDLKEISGSVSIGSYSTATSYLLPRKLKGFSDLYPKIKFSFDYSSTSEILKKVKNLELDCAIISEVPEDKGIEKVPLYEDEMILVKSFNSDIPDKLSKQDLVDCKYISYPLKHDYCYRKVDELYGKYTKKAPTTLVSEFYITIKEAIIADMGISFVPRYLVAEELQNKKLKVIDLEEDRIPINFYFVTKNNRKLPNKIIAFRDFLIKQF